MNKYIIELDENAKEVVVISLEDGDMWTETMEVEDLEQLNSDYINEHFGDLQDTAYQKGFEDGKAVHDKECEGCKYEGRRTSEENPCFSCSKYYQNYWTAKDDKIEVGDEVETKNGTIFVVTKVTADNLVVGLINDGSNCIFRAYKVVKTGRHFDIASILEEMRK